MTLDGSILQEVLARGGEVAVRLLVAAVALVGSVLIARLVRPLIRSVLARAGRPSRARVFSGLVSIAIMVAGALIGATIAFPSVEVADVLASVGLLSVAIGFAFKDVLENVLAGVMLILRDPFQSGDEIRVGEWEGTVEGITVRETLLRTFDGQRVLVPNRTVFIDAIEVRTHAPVIRQHVEVEVDVTADVEQLRGLLTGVMMAVDGVESSPPPDVVAVEVSPTVRLDCRFWTAAARSAMTAARDEVVEGLRRTLVEYQVPLPSESVTVTGGTVTTAPDVAGREQGG